VYSTTISITVFACSFGGALLAMKLRTILPDHHLSDQSRDTIKVGTGLIGTMTALVLGLVTASTMSAFQNVDAEVKHTAADILSLDRTLAQYGPETGPIREEIKLALKSRIGIIWPSGNSQTGRYDPSAGASKAEALAAQIRGLKPQTEDQRWLQSRALDLAESVLEARWLIFEGARASVGGPFLAILVFWLTITFASFGLFAPQNGTVVTVLFVCALSVAGAIFLILELDRPFEGMMRISAEPLRQVFAP